MNHLKYNCLRENKKTWRSVWLALSIHCSLDLPLMNHSWCCQFCINKVTISTSAPSPTALSPLNASKALSLPFSQSFSKNHSSVVKEAEQVRIVPLFLKGTIEFACFSVPDSEYQIKRAKPLFHLPPYYCCAKIPIKKLHNRQAAP